jgi:AraC-like DNA-binding protein
MLDSMKQGDLFLINCEESHGLIALEVGFSSSAYYNKLFKKDKGITPLVYRKKAK